MIQWLFAHCFHRQSQAGLVSENFEQKLLLDTERKKAHETAEKAHQMIKVNFFFSFLFFITVKPPI